MLLKARFVLVVTGKRGMEYIVKEVWYAESQGRKYNQVRLFLLG